MDIFHNALQQIQKIFHSLLICQGGFSNANFSQHSKQFAAVGNWSSILTYTVILVVFYALPNFALAHEECHEKGFGDFREPPTEMMRPMPPGEMMAELPHFHGGS